MPKPLFFEWNYYLAWEVQQWTQAIMQALPFAKKMEDFPSQVIEDPKEIGNVLDFVGKL